MFGDLLSVFYPLNCPACGLLLYKSEKVICSQCRFHLPKTHFHHDSENMIARQFWGRVPLSAAASLFYFDKKEKVQRLIHQLKYKGRKEIGVLLGEIYGGDLMESEAYREVDFIIPVPLHPGRKKRRGYNQSELFARGLGISMQKKVDPNLLIRHAKTATQTRKTRFARWENVNNVFGLTDAVRPGEGKHFLLADDVITTGATIEACAQTLLQIPGAKVSVAAIAYAPH